LLLLPFTDIPESIREEAGSSTATAAPPRPIPPPVVGER